MTNIEDFPEEIHPLVNLRDYLRTLSSLATEFADFLSQALDHPETIDDHEAFGDQLQEKMSFIGTAFVSMTQSMLGDEMTDKMLEIVNAEIAKENNQ